MPLPKILRKFGHKSVRSKDQPSSSNSNGDEERCSPSSDKEPPLPIKQTTISPLIDSDMSQPNGKVRGTPEPPSLAMGIPTPMPTPSITEVTSSFSPELVDAWNVSHKEAPKSGKVDGFLSKIGKDDLVVHIDMSWDIYHISIEDGVSATSGAQAMMDPMNASAETTGVTEAIEKGVNGFLETMPIFMKALDEVSKVHPFISGMT